MSRPLRETICITIQKSPPGSKSNQTGEDKGPFPSYGILSIAGRGSRKKASRAARDIGFGIGPA